MDSETLREFFSTIAQTTNTVYLAYQAHELLKKKECLETTMKFNSIYKRQPLLICKKGDDPVFKSIRMNIDNFKYLFMLLKQSLERFSKKKPVDPETRLIVTLLYLAQGSSIQVLAREHELGKSTIRKIIYETCDSIWQELHKIYLPPPSTAKFKNIADEFYVKTGLPNCLGAIDGKYIRIGHGRRKKCSAQYRRQQNTTSIILLAASDSNHIFTYADLTKHGNESNGNIFAQSDFGKSIIEGTLKAPTNCNLPGTTISFPYYFVANQAFPLKNNLMRPYPGRSLTTDKENFNKILSQVRLYIESTFNILANRWQILHSNLQTRPANAYKIILATIVLHNFLIVRNDEKYFTPESDSVGIDNVGPLESFKPTMYANRSAMISFDLRDALKDFLQNKQNANECFGDRTNESISLT